jgi:hypothetical protein
MSTLVGAGWRGLGAAMLLAVVGAYATVLGRLRGYERAARAGAPWWFGYARDGVNLAAAASLFAAFLVAGFTGPAALVLAALLALAAYLVDWATGRWLALRRARPVTIAATAALGGAMLIGADAVAERIGEVLTAVAPR